MFLCNVEGNTGLCRRLPNRTLSHLLLPQLTAICCDWLEQRRPVPDPKKTLATEGLAPQNSGRCWFHCVDWVPSYGRPKMEKRSWHNLSHMWHLQQVVLVGEWYWNCRHALIFADISWHLLRCVLRFLVREQCQKVGTKQGHNWIVLVVPARTNDITHLIHTYCLVHEAIEITIV